MPPGHRRSRPSGRRRPPNGTREPEPMRRLPRTSPFPVRAGLRRMRARPANPPRRGNGAKPTSSNTAPGRRCGRNSAGWAKGSPRRGVLAHGVQHLGNLLHEHEYAHREHEVPETSAQRLLGDPPGKGGSRKRASDRDEGEGEHEGPIELHGYEIAAEAREGFHRDDEQRGADGDRHRQPTEKIESGDDEEPAADCFRPRSIAAAVATIMIRSEERRA